MEMVVKTPVGEVSHEVVLEAVKGFRKVFVLDMGNYWFETFDGASGTMYSKTAGYESLEKVREDLERRGYRVI